LVLEGGALAPGGSGYQVVSRWLAGGRGLGGGQHGGDDGEDLELHVCEWCLVVVIEV
jgi:hypothetical protein